MQLLLFVVGLFHYIIQQLLKGLFLDLSFQCYFDKTLDQLHLILVLVLIVDKNNHQQVQLSQLLKLYLIETVN